MGFSDKAQAGQRREEGLAALDGDGLNVERGRAVTTAAVQSGVRAFLWQGAHSSAASRRGTASVSSACALSALSLALRSAADSAILPASSFRSCAADPERSIKRRAQSICACSGNQACVVGSGRGRRVVSAARRRHDSRPCVTLLAYERKLVAQNTRGDGNLLMEALQVSFQLRSP